METQTYKATTTPGREVFRLTKEEACRAMFAFAKGRIPMDDEVQRLILNVYDDCELGREWQLTLTVNDAPAKDGER